MQVDLGSQSGCKAHLRKPHALEANGRTIVLGNREVGRQPRPVTLFHHDTAFHRTRDVGSVRVDPSVGVAGTFMRPHAVQLRLPATNLYSGGAGPL